MLKTLKLSVRVYFSAEDIKNLLDSASRGSDYWCENSLAYERETNKALTPIGVKVKDFEAEDKPVVHTLNLAKIKKGLTVMAKKFPEHFGDFHSGNYDMNTGDVFLQCCLFGDVIYG